MLQERFGIGAHEALDERPAWEIENLMEHFYEERRQRMKDDAAARLAEMKRNQQDPSTLAR